MNKPTFKAIPKFHQPASFRCNYDWRGLEHALDHWIHPKDGLCTLDLDPEFQRAHVWTEAQQIAYVEYIIQGGYSGKEIYFNCIGWQGSYKEPFVLVDGKQRLTAVLKFLRNDLRAFGHYFNEYEDRLPSHCEFLFNVNKLPTTKAVLEWYIHMNAGGTPHTPEELSKVKYLVGIEYAKELLAIKK